MSHINVDFIIPTLNTNPASLSACQNSIHSQTGPFNKKIYIEKGYGFAEGVNRGIKKGKSPYIAIINDDVKLDNNWLKEAFNVLENHLGCAAVASRVLTYDGNNIDSCGMDIFAIGKAKNRGEGEKVEEVFGVPCSAALFKRTALEKAGLFDEDFTSYEEDVDLSFILRLLGFKIYYAPKAIAYHKMQDTSSKMGNLKVRMDAKNWIYIIIKNYPAETIFKFAFGIILERGRNLSGLIKTTLSIYGWRSIWLLPQALISTYGEVIQKIPLMLKKRYELERDKSYNSKHLQNWLISGNTN